MMHQKKFPLALILALVSPVLLAGPVNPLTLSSASRSRVQPVQMDPFTDTPIVFEQEQRLLEETRLQTQIMVEQAKQVQLKAVINPHPLPSHAGFIRLKGRFSPRLDLKRKKPSFHPDAVTVKNRVKTQRTARLLPGSFPLGRKPAYRGPVLSAVIQDGEVLTAVLTDAGETRFVKVGKTYRGMPVTAIGLDSVTIGGRHLDLKTTPSIIALKDDLPKNGTGGSKPVMPFMLSAGTPGIQTPASSSSNLSSGYPALPVQR
ncbi:MAG: hypothetical protein KGI54_06050 [Pseudomonadota bacterium]|nr:hypothetical protein [Pseudomonadota bacterium]